MNIKIFADTASLDEIRMLAPNPLVQGFTCNPTLMRKAGVTDYAAFAKEAAVIVAPRPISFEVFADNLDDMERQARIIAGWGDNINVKIPVTNTRAQFTGPVVDRLVRDGVKINVTAVFTEAQIDAVLAYMPTYVSVFAGRIADTGRDPVPYVRRAARECACIWASTREVYNIYQAEMAGCQVITVTPDILAKFEANKDKSLDLFSLDTVKMFHSDAAKAGYTIATGYGEGGF